jgi:hypothetical protein
MSARRIAKASFPAALALAALFLAAPARAEDPAPAAPPAAPPAAAPTGVPTPLQKAEHAFLDGLVGSWDVVVKAHGTELKGTDRWSKVAGDTAWLHELSFGDGAFHGLGVLRLTPDGKGLTMWWFDSMGKGAVWTFQGTVTAEGFEVASDEGGMKATKGLAKAEGGLTYRMTVNGAEVVAGTWRKRATPAAAPEAPKECPLGKHPFVQAQLGDWTLETTSMGAPYTGTARFRLGVGGHYVLEDYALVGGDERHHGFGVSSISADGKTLRSWWFGNYFREPVALSGAVTEKGWLGKGEGPMGEMTVDVRKTETGMESVVSAAGGVEVMREKYARPKAK